MAEKPTVMQAVINRTAGQLGISPDEVTLETEIPDIHSLGTFVAIDVNKAILVEDLTRTYTVQEAIEMLER